MSNLHVCRTIFQILYIGFWFITTPLVFSWQAVTFHILQIIFQIAYIITNLLQSPENFKSNFTYPMELIFLILFLWATLFHYKSNETLPFPFLLFISLALCQSKQTQWYLSTINCLQALLGICSFIMSESRLAPKIQGSYIELRFPSTIHISNSSWISQHISRWQSKYFIHHSDSPALNSQQYLIKQLYISTELE